MQTPPKVRILPMDSQNEFNGSSIEYVQQNFFKRELPSRKNCRYFYHKFGLKAPPGTVVLFQYDSRIIASAIFRGAERFKEPEKEGYGGVLYFDAESIRVFEPVDPATISMIWPEFKGFGRAKWSLNPERYPLFVKNLSGIEVPDK